MTNPMIHLAQAVKFSIQIQELKDELNEIPVKVREVEGEIQSLLGEYQGKKSTLDQFESQKKQLEEELSTESERLKQKEERLNAIKTQKEYQAVVREITTAKTSNREREARIQKLSQDLEALTTEVAPLEEKLQNLKGQLEAEKTNIQGSLNALEAKIEDLQGQLNTQLSALPDDIRQQYRMIEERMQPPAVSVVAGACQGCFMHLPPQLYIELQKGQKVLSCPNCHRLLYLQAED